MSEKVSVNSRTQETSKFERSYYLDWLIIAGVFLVYFVHLISNYRDKLIGTVNPVYAGIDAIAYGIGAIGIPAFFLVSGMNIYNALRKYNAKQLILGKFLRLMIPFIFTQLTLNIITSYYSVLQNGTFTGTLIDYLSVYFTNLWGYDTPAIGFDWRGFHLYYILYLFIFSLITIPLFLLFKKEKGQQIIDKIGNFFKIPGTLYLPFLLILGIEFFDIKVIQVYVPAFVFGRSGGWSFLTYFILIIYGFIIASNKKFEVSIDKHSKFSGFLTIILGAIGLPIFLLNKSSAEFAALFRTLSLSPPNIYSFTILLLNPATLI